MTTKMQRKVRKDMVLKAKRMMKLVPKLEGIWSDKSDEEIEEMSDFVRGKKEVGYMKRFDKR